MTATQTAQHPIAKLTLVYDKWLVVIDSNVLQLASKQAAVAAFNKAPHAELWGLCHEGNVTVWRRYR